VSRIDETLVPAAGEGVLRALRGHPRRLLLPALLLALAAAAWWRSAVVDDRARVAGSRLSAAQVLAARAPALAEAAARGDPGALAGARALAPRLREAATAAGPGASPARWSGLAEAFERVLAGLAEGASLEADIERFRSIAAGVLVVGDELLDTLLGGEAPAATVRAVARQLVIIERVLANLQRLGEGGVVALAAADRIGRDMVRFGRTNLALITGDAALGIPAVAAPEAQRLVADLDREFREGAALVERILRATASRGDVRAALEALAAAGARLEEALAARARGLAAARQAEPPWRMLGWAALALALLGLAGAAARIGADQRRLGRRLALARDSERALRAELDEAELGLQRLGTEVQRMARGGVAEWHAGHYGPAAALARAVRELYRALEEERSRLRAALEALGRELHGLGGQGREIAGGLGEALARLEHARGALDPAGAPEGAGELAERLRRERREAARLAEGCAALERELAAIDEVHDALEERAARLAEAAGGMREVARMAGEHAERARIAWINTSLRAASEPGAAAPLAAAELDALIGEARELAGRAGSAAEQAARGESTLRPVLKRGRWSRIVIGRLVAESGRALGRIEEAVGALERELEAAATTRDRARERTLVLGRELVGLAETLRRIRAGAGALAERLSRSALRGELVAEVREPARDPIVSLVEHSAGRPASATGRRGEARGERR